MAALCDDDFDFPDPVEVHWSARTILAIFFAASLVSAVFFGLGYSFGGAATSKRSVAVASEAGSAPAETNAKPTGTTALQASSNHEAAFSQPAASANVLENSSAQPHETAALTLPLQIHPATVPRIAHSAVIVARKSSKPAANGSHVMIQVGAIGNRRNADRLVAELRKKGFRAGIYSAKHDKFLHVQIGPFKDAQQAQFKRHQVMASGFHAILKSAS